METSEFNNSENVSNGLPCESKGSEDPGDPPLEGAKDLGEQLGATLLEMAVTSAVVKEERSKLTQEIFDRRNLANREWQVLDTKGQKEREASELETERALAEVAELAGASIQQQELELLRYAEEAERRRKEKAKETERIERQIVAESEASMHNIAENQRRSDEARSQAVLHFKQEKQSEIDSVKQGVQKELVDMDDDFRKQMEEIEREKQRRLAIERLRREEVVKKANSWSFRNPFSYTKSQKPN